MKRFAYFVVVQLPRHSNDNLFQTPSLSCLASDPPAMTGCTRRRMPCSVARDLRIKKLLFLFSRNFKNTLYSNSVNLRYM